MSDALNCMHAVEQLPVDDDVQTDKISLALCNVGMEDEGVWGDGLVGSDKKEHCYFDLADDKMAGILDSN